MRALGALVALGGVAMFLYLVFWLPDIGEYRGVVAHVVRFVSFGAVAGGCWLLVRPRRD